MWGRCLRAEGGGGGGPSKRHLGPDPYLGVLNLFVVSKSMLVASSARHLLVTEKNVPPI